MASAMPCGDPLGYGVRLAVFKLLSADTSVSGAALTRCPRRSKCTASSSCHIIHYAFSQTFEADFVSLQSTP